MIQRVVYLPVEIKHRELPSRLLLASHLLQAGYTVVVGNHWSMTTPANSAALPAGLFLFKTVNKVQGAIMTGVREAGHIVAASDEEVLVFTEYNGYTNAFADEAAASCELFLAQSETHKQAVERKFPHLAGRVVATGSPRVDLMSPGNRHVFTAMDERVAPLKPYILFNTNYATINSIWNTGGAINMGVHEETGAFDGPDRALKKKLFFETVTWEQANHQAMVALMHWAIQNIRGLRFVVRPHPVERNEYWEQMLRGVPNAVVLTQSDPHPWVLGAELLVHTGCTTGLEAALLGKPALNLLPSDRPGIGQITNLVNATVRTAQEAAQAMADFLSAGKGPIAAVNPEPALRSYLSGYRDGAAARLMAEALTAKLTERGAKEAPLAWRGAFADVSRTDLQKKKFTVGAEEVKDGLAKAAKIARTRARSRIATLGDSLFLLAPA